MRIHLAVSVFLSTALVGCATPRPAHEATCNLSRSVMASDIPEQPLSGEIDTKYELIVRAAPNPEVSENLLTDIRRVLEMHAENDEDELAILSLSTGGEWGAFGSGFLEEMVTRGYTNERYYDVVTGASTGSIIAPFAYLGTEADLQEASLLYKTLSDDKVLKRRSKLSLLKASSLYDTARLKALILTTLEKHDMVRRIAEEYRASGRVLLVAAVNLDTGFTDVFNISRIAADESLGDRRKDMIAERIQASAAIPIAFNPVLIDGCLYTDAGVRQNLFVTGELIASIAEARGAIVDKADSRFGGKEFRIDLGDEELTYSMRVELHLLVNGSANINPQITDYGLLPIGLRVIPAMMNQATWASIDRLRLSASLLRINASYSDAGGFIYDGNNSVFSTSGEVFRTDFMIKLNEYAKSVVREFGPSAWTEIPGGPDILGPPTALCENACDAPVSP